MAGVCHGSGISTETPKHVAAPVDLGTHQLPHSPELLGLWQQATIVPRFPCQAAISYNSSWPSICYTKGRTDMDPEAQIPKTTMRLTTPMPLALTAVLVLLQLISPHRTWVILLCAAGTMTLSAYLWACSLASSVRVTRSLHYVVAQVGDLLEERFVAHNQGSWPLLWAEIEDHSTVPGYPSGRVASAGGREAYRWTVRVTCRRRGLFTLGPWTVRMREPLGLFTVVQHYDETRSLLVIPAIMRLPEVLLPRGVAVGQAVARRPATAWTVNVSATRDYHPGDPLRHIHWASTAHTGSLMTKTFDDEVSGDLWIVLDLDAGVQAGEGEESTEEYGVMLAASLADLMLRRGHAVGLVAYGTHNVYLMPQRGEGQLWRILRALALVQNAEQRPLATVLSEMCAALGRQATVMVITASSDVEWVEAIPGLLHQGTVPTAILLDPVTFGGNGDLGPVRSMLDSIGIATHVIAQGYPFVPSAGMDQRRATWEFKLTPFGRAIAVRSPREAST